MKMSDGNRNDKDGLALVQPEIVELVESKLQELRKRLLDSSRRNPLININFRPTSTSVMRVVDELPDVLRYNLTNGQSMRLVPLPALEDQLPDEQTDSFLEALFLARSDDETYLKAIEKIDPSSKDAAEKEAKIERDLKDRLRESLDLPARQTKDDLSLTKHAEAHGISPSYSLPSPNDEHEDGRHQDTDIQTLMLPEKLSRTAKGILEKGRGFERETGVNVLHAAFGVLEWKDPSEREKYSSPLLLLEIRIERRQSPRGAQFYVSGIDKIFINTTLAQKLHSEHRLTIPEYESGSIEEYFDEVQDKAPSGWHWNVRREVAFGIFPSSKIAMYHDLDPEKRPLAENPLIARLMATSGGGDGSYAEEYGTDDPDVSRKVPHLVMDADASQYSSLVDIADGKSLALEGPPGSGKSQTIVNMIAAALADGKKVLFVAEKLTALDVVKNRLEAASLGEFILPLQAGKGTREKVYDSLEERMALGRGTKRHRGEYENRQIALERRRAVLQNYLDALASDFGTTGMTVYETIGHGIATTDTRDSVPKEVRRIHLERSEALTSEQIDALVADAESFADRFGKTHRMPTLWLESNAMILNRDDAEDICEIAGDLANSLEAYDRDFRLSGLAPLVAAAPLETELGEIETLLKTIEVEAGRIDQHLVEKLAEPSRRRTVRDFCGQVHDWQSEISRLGRHLKKPKDCSIDEYVTAARSFALANGNLLSPDAHQKRLTGLEEKIARAEAICDAATLVDTQWTDRDDTTLREIQISARKILDFPEDIRGLRVADPEAAVGNLEADISSMHLTLATELGRIRQYLPNAGKHDPGSIHNAAATIENAGAFRFLSSQFKSAKNIYANVLGGQKSDARTIMATHLKTYAQWLDRAASFEKNSRFQSAFRTFFQGLDTDLGAISKVSAFYGQIAETAKGDDQLKLALETGELSMLVPIAAAPDAPDVSFDTLKQEIESFQQERETEISRLHEAREHLAIFDGHDQLSLDELDEIATQQANRAELAGLIDVSPARSILGSRFSGTSTDTDILDVECKVAEAFAKAPNPQSAIELLCSDAATKLLPELEDFKHRLKHIEHLAGQLIHLLALDGEHFTSKKFFGRVCDLKAAAADAPSLMERARLRRSEDTLREQGFGILVDWVLKQGQKFEPSRLGPIVRSVIAKNMVDRAYEIQSEALQGYDGEEFNRIRAEIVEKDRQLIAMSRDVIRNQLLAEASPPSGNNIGRKSSYTDMSLIINEMHKKRNRLGVRELTRRAGQALLELKPCWMMSPLAVSQYLHEGLTFDLVVIDEASQMTPENAVGALSRAQQAVVVGDTKQLPPTSFFTKMLDESDIDEDLREDSESILDMANIAFMPIRQLRWHYRSRHSALIQFSNKWMYKNELTIFPSAHEDNPELGVELVEVGGVYKSRTNEVEARAIVKAAVQHMTHSPNLSLGICTMNTDQKNLIVEEFERERDRNRKVQDYIRRWEEENDALEEFFIKNLETIQGDERDVMFISTLYGPETAGGRPHQRFGPINSVHGHRRLNVLFTRAKRKIVTFTSLKPSDILADESKNLGVQMFRAWLEYSKTGLVPDKSSPGGEADSPFEEYVIRQIETLGCEAVPQVGAAGYRIDIGVRHPDWPYGYILGVECDGATYHSSKSSRDRDRLRQEVLEGLGWKLHRIWSTDWFNDPRTEILFLKDAIEAALEQANEKSQTTDRRTAELKLPSELVEETKPKIADDETNENSVQSFSNGSSRHPTQIALPIVPGENDLFSKGSEIVTDSNEARRIQDLVDNADPIVSLGSRVKIENISEGGKKLAFTLVDGKNDPDQGIVGTHTPLGQALLDAQEGDEVEYQVGVHIKEVRVLTVE